MGKAECKVESGQRTRLSQYSETRSERLTVDKVGGRLSSVSVVEQMETLAADRPELFSVLSSMSLEERASTEYYRCVHAPSFEMLSACFIVLNACVVGAEANWKMHNRGSKQMIILDVLDWMCNLAFTIELLLRTVAEKRWFISRDNKNLTWNLFDSFIVLSVYVGVIVQNVSASSMNVSALRLLRILRLVRVFRILRVVRFFSVLRTMIGGILSSAKLLMWALCLLGMIMYTFAVCVLQVLAEELAPGTALDETVKESVLRHYHSLWKTMYTLFLSICGGNNWGDVAEPLLKISPLLCIGFSIYIAFVVFCVLNIVTGIFVENANKLITNDEERMVMEESEKRRRWAREVLQVFADGDSDASGELDWDEFQRMLSDPRVQAYLHKLGVDWEMYSKQSLFMQLDFDGNGFINRTEFFLAMQNLHGPARSIDISHLKHSFRVLQRKIDNVETILMDTA